MFKAIVGMLGTFHRGGMSNLALSGLAAKHRLGDVSDVLTVSVQWELPVIMPVGTSCRVY
jgi:hypothetical protein